MKPRNHLVYSLVWSAATFAVSAYSGTVEQAILIAEPQMQVKEGRVLGCGFRLKSIPSAFAEQSAVVLLDSSFNLYSSGLGMLKAGAMQIYIKDGKAGQPTNRQIESFWLKVQGEKPTAALNGKVLAAETKGYLLYGESIESIGKLFVAVAQGTPITVGVRIKGEPVDRMYAGAAQLTDQDKGQGGQCMNDLIKQLDAAQTPPARP